MEMLTNKKCNLTLVLVVEFGVIEREGKALCCICNQVSTMRFYSISHFDSKHSNLCSTKEDKNHNLFKEK